MDTGHQSVGSFQSLVHDYSDREHLAPENMVAVKVNALDMFQPVKHLTRPAGLVVEQSRKSLSPLFASLVAREGHVA